MNRLYKITLTEDLEVVDCPKWCVLAFGQDTNRVLCTGDALDGGSSFQYETKVVKKGGITCEDCLLALKHYKAIKL